MKHAQRIRMQLLVSSLIGLELSAIGESELTATAEDDWMRLRARLLVYEAMFFPRKVDDEKCQEATSDDEQ